MELLIVPKTNSQDFGVVVHHDAYNMPYIEPNRHFNANIGIAMVNNCRGAITIVGKAPWVVLLDMVTQPSILSKKFIAYLGVSIWSTN